MTNTIQIPIHNPSQSQSSEQATQPDVTSMAQTFSQYYEAHHQQVYRYMLAKTGNREDAHDLTAVTFLAAYESYDNFNGQSQFITWIMSIARHKLIDFYRAKREQVALGDLPDIPHPAPLPEEAVQHSLRLQRVADAMQALSEDRQEAIALRLFAGLTNPEIADVMDKSPAAIAMLVHRALQDLQDRLANGDQKQ